MNMQEQRFKQACNWKKELGANPYKFGMIGSTDSHTGLATAEEENFFGKHSGTEPSAERYLHPMAKTETGAYESWDMVGSGLAAVWAKENTREAIFDAMMRKETYATTGPRIMVRFFGGWDFTDKDVMHRLPADIGYVKGVTMGSGPERSTIFGCFSQFPGSRLKRSLFREPRQDPDCKRLGRWEWTAPGKGV